MTTDFLHNPINTAILGAVAIFAISAIIYILIKKNISFSRENGLQFQTAEQSMTSAIPRIDNYMKSQLYSILNNNKDRILGILNDFRPVERMLVAKIILEVIKERININHFANIMSSIPILQSWIEDRVISCMQKIIYCMNDCMEIFSEPVMVACYDKIVAYSKYPNDSKCKKNIGKNEVYIEDIKQTFSQLKKNRAAQ